MILTNVNLFLTFLNAVGVEVSNFYSTYYSTEKKSHTVRSDECGDH